VIHDLSAAGSDPVHLRGVAPGQVRSHNTRLILDLLRRHRALAGAEIARLTGLSAQTVSVLTRNLERLGLIRRGAPLRGRVGQPSVPFSLDPDGAFYLGARIGRRGAELVVLDFVGARRGQRDRAYAWPDPAAVADWLATAAGALAADLGPRADRLCAAGIAMPFRLWDWQREAGAPDGALDGWRSADPAAALRDLGLPVVVVNDATAACAGELAFGTAIAREAAADVLYVFVGTFIGGGLVQGGALVEGPAGNAAAIGSMLVADGRGKPVQLIEQASLVLLDRAVGATGPSRTDPQFWTLNDALVQPWLDRAGRAIAQAAISAVALTDCRHVVIDGAFPRHVHDLLIDRTARWLANLDSAGIELPRLHRGTLGPAARTLGAAARAMALHPPPIGDDP
jgi:predicted NBD/HSP70 family sugar kinase